MHLPRGNPRSIACRRENLQGLTPTDNAPNLRWKVSHTARRTLNRIQSRIYPTAFGSNENILVSAPTGAGKTNIAMIAVLREVGANMAGGMIDKAAFKVVYVAPMKALAAEVTAAFAHRLAPLGEERLHLPAGSHS